VLGHVADPATRLTDPDQKRPSHRSYSLKALRAVRTEPLGVMVHDDAGTKASDDYHKGDEHEDSSLWSTRQSSATTDRM
jgi:hypothetical protein